MKTILLPALALFVSAGGLLAQGENAGRSRPATQRVAFAQHCFWTGEMKLGQIDGVVRTEAGFFKGREVTLVDYAPEQLTLEELARRAKQAGVADVVHLQGGAQPALPGITRGAVLDGSYRAAPASDQKKQIEGTPFSRLQLEAGQATKVNAFARANPAKALEWLTPLQREQIKGVK